MSIAKCRKCGLDPQTWFDMPDIQEGFNIDCCGQSVCRIFEREAIEAWNDDYGPCQSCESLRAESAALKKRLEINPAAPEYDGISCRDETIKHLEKQVADLKLALESDYR